jgi:Flp pilus assembly protein protease CpaA
MKKKCAVLVALAALLTEGAWACPVCFGAADAKILAGMNLSIVFMLILTYTVVGGFIGFFLFLRWKQKQLISETTISQNTTRVPGSRRPGAGGISTGQSPRKQWTGLPDGTGE